MASGRRDDVTEQMADWAETKTVRQLGGAPRCRPKAGGGGRRPRSSRASLLRDARRAVSSAPARCGVQHSSLTR